MDGESFGLWAMLARAGTLGLSSGFFCIGACYPILAPLALGRDDGSWSRSARSVLLFLAGRLVAYMVVGLMAGALGAVALGQPWFARGLAPAAQCVAGAALVFYGLAPSLRARGSCEGWVQRLDGKGGALALGALAGINVCPPFIVAVSDALTLGGAMRGMAFFIVFFAATSLWFTPFLLAGAAAKVRDVRWAARVAAIGGGAWVLARAAAVFFI